MGQWVFTLNCVSEDLQVVSKALKTASPTQDLRGSIFFYRALLARLYEARRLIRAFQDHDVIREFLGDDLPKPSGVDLLALYAPEADGRPSLIERLYRESRHRTVHYPQVGGSELRELLHNYQRYPARIETKKVDGHLSVQNQWVTVVRSVDIFGDLSAGDVLARLETLQRVTSQAVLGWLFANGVLTMVYAMKRGIAMERLVDDPEELRALVAEHQATRAAGREPPRDQANNKA